MAYEENGAKNEWKRFKMVKSDLNISLLFLSLSLNSVLYNTFDFITRVILWCQNLETNFVWKSKLKSLCIVQICLEKIRVLQCPPLNRIILDRHKSDNNNQMIQLTNVFCVLLVYNEASDISAMLKLWIVFR